MADRARILEITSYPPPRSGWGVRVSYVKQALEALGHDCVVLNTGPSRRTPSAEYVDVQHGLDYCRKVLRFSLAGYTVHGHVNGDSPKGLLLTLAAQLINLACGRTPVLTFHAGPVQRCFPQSRSRLMAPAYRIAFLLAQPVICNSDDVKQAIAGYGIDAGKIAAIPAFSPQYLRFDPATLAAPLEAFLDRHDPVLCSYAFFRPEFFLDSLVDAIGRVAARHPGVGLVLMGADQGAAPIRARIRDAGLADRIHLAGDLHHDAFLTLLTRSTIYVRTPSKDGVASSVLEALALKVPVVASENGTRPAGVVTFRPDDPADLAMKIAEVLSDYDEVRRNLVPPVIRDTVAEEAALLAAAGLPSRPATA